MMNIVITGFMGTGKTTVGKELSGMIGFPFFDTDTLIENRADRTIPIIFKELGEPHFRKLEREILLELSPLLGVVIATGGGTLLDPLNLKIIERNGIIVCLTARLDTILERIGNSKNRPLLPQMETLFEERHPLYQKLPNLMDTSSSTPKETAQKIMKLYEENPKGVLLRKRIYEPDPD